MNLLPYFSLRPDVQRRGDIPHEAGRRADRLRRLRPRHVPGELGSHHRLRRQVGGHLDQIILGEIYRRRIIHKRRQRSSLLFGGQIGGQNLFNSLLR